MSKLIKYTNLKAVLIHKKQMLTYTKSSQKILFAILGRGRVRCLFVVVWKYFYIIIKESTRLESSVGCKKNPGMLLITGIAILDEKYQEDFMKFDI